MEREPESEPFTRFRAAGGVVDYSVFRAWNEESCIREAMQRHFAELQDLGPVWRPWLKIDSLDALPRRTISERQFFGDWCDPERRVLKLLGSGTMKGRGHMTDPLYTELDGCRALNWGSDVPDLGSGGQYAYAFSQAPHGLFVGFTEAQKLFSQINDIIIPTGTASRIVDWSSSELGKLSNYFDAGLEWWGVFLFTIHIPELSRLTVISASTTD